MAENLLVWLQKGQSIQFFVVAMYINFGDYWTCSHLSELIRQGHIIHGEKPPGPDNYGQLQPLAMESLTDLEHLIAKLQQYQRSFTGSPLSVEYYSM